MEISSLLTEVMFVGEQINCFKENKSKGKKLYWLKRSNETIYQVWKSLLLKIVLPLKFFFFFFILYVQYTKNCVTLQ